MVYERVPNRKRNQACAVCGDEAVGINYGVICCEPCKAFYRRNYFKTFRGRCQGDCVVDVVNRQYCKRCRLKKCYTVGMRRKKGKESHPTRTSVDVGPSCSPRREDPRNAPTPKPPNLEDVLTPNEMSLLNNAVDILNPNNPKDVAGAARSLGDIVSMAEQTMRVNILFAKSLPQFRQLEMEDQVALMKGTMVESMTLGSMTSFDLGSKSWVFPSPRDPLGVKIVTLQSELIDQICSDGYSRLAYFYVHTIKRDKRIIALVKAMCLFSPDRPNVADLGKVGEFQQYFAELLEKVTNVLFPGQGLFPKIMASVCTMRTSCHIYASKLSKIGRETNNDLISEVLS